MYGGIMYVTVLWFIGISFCTCNEKEILKINIFLKNVTYDGLTHPIKRKKLIAKSLKDR